MRLCGSSSPSSRGKRGRLTGSQTCERPDVDTFTNPCLRKVCFLCLFASLLLQWTPAAAQSVWSTRRPFQANTGNAFGIIQIHSDRIYRKHAAKASPNVAHRANVHMLQHEKHDAVAAPPQFANGNETETQRPGKNNCSCHLLGNVTSSISS